MRILIIEDNPLIAQVLRKNLSAFYSVDVCKNGNDGLLQAQHTKYDTVLLDLNLPDIDGQEVCRRLRKEGNNVPIIVASGNSEVDSKVNMLSIGADDYITKPFNIHELHARIDVCIRHASRSGLTGKLFVDGLELNPLARTVIRYNDKIVLRRKEFDLLEYLMRNMHQTLTRPMILEHIWDMNENLWANVVDVHIKHLRDKIDRPYGSVLIKTVHGLGYKFEPNDVKSAKKV